MIEHEHLRHLEAFARYGTLSKAAEELHISQPTLTRSMQKLEDEIGVPLFLRTKNHLEFNANGELAADYARRILEQTDSMVERVRALDRAGRTISIGSCAPMPMLTAVRNATHLYPEMTISSECRDCEPLIEGSVLSSIRLLSCLIVRKIKICIYRKQKRKRSFSPSLPDIGLLTAMESI